jgi:hypothetical protein
VVWRVFKELKRLGLGSSGDNKEEEIITMRNSFYSQKFLDLLMKIYVNIYTHSPST